MSQSVREFYDRFADESHLIYPDWRNAVRRQGAVLDRLVRSFLGEQPAAVLDCACGIGTQAIGLALRGHRVTATDLSERSVERARVEAKSFDVELELATADFRRLGDVLDGTYDVVLACDNALPHLTAHGDLARAAASMRARLAPGGLFVGSIRDYDEALRTRPAVTEPQVFDGPDGRRVYLQVWDWSGDGSVYEVTLFLLRRDGERWSQTTHRTTYRALRREELTAILAEAGFVQVRWHMPAETGFFQPVVTARPG
jgi:SAM-dependent methyltransferase